MSYKGNREIPQSDSLKPVPTGGRRILIFASKIEGEKISSKDLARGPRLWRETEKAHYRRVKRHFLIFLFLPK